MYLAIPSCNWGIGIFRGAFIGAPFFGLLGWLEFEKLSKRSIRNQPGTADFFAFQSAAFHHLIKSRAADSRDRASFIYAIHLNGQNMLERGFIDNPRIELDPL
jgi:hypothetical protein